MKQFKQGDWVIYSKQKFSVSPGPRAKSIHAAKQGEEYSYIVDKYWAVADWVDENSLLLCTRTGKEHKIMVDDPHLRQASWWERWLLANKFPQQLNQEIQSSA